MPRPTRRQPNYYTWSRAPHGRMFLEWLEYLLGEDFSAEGLAKTKNAEHLWHLAGDRGWGTLVEVARPDEGVLLVHEASFRMDFPRFGSIIQIDMVYYRWFAEYVARVTGDHSISVGSASWRRGEYAQKAEEIGAAKDTLTMRFVPLAEAPETMIGLTIGEVNAARKEYGARQERRARRQQKAAQAKANPANGAT